MITVNGNDVVFKTDWGKSNLDLIAKIKSHKQTKSYFGIYDIWLIYSKYEHYGGLTYNMERVSIIDKINVQAKSIHIIILGIINAIQMFIDINKIKDFENENLNKLFTCIGNLTDSLIKYNVLKTEK